MFLALKIAARFGLPATTLIRMVGGPDGTHQCGETGKEGGDWSEDIQEASNITCYGDNIHPNLVGATPGKGQSNNSGSDKRELFTLKQALEIPFHDLMNIPHNIVIEYNGWSEKVYPDVPMVLLTTLDQNTDAKQKTASDLESKS